MTKNDNTSDERLWILKECARMKSVKVEVPPDAKSPEQMLRAFFMGISGTAGDAHIYIR